MNDGVPPRAASSGSHHVDVWVLGRGDDPAVAALADAPPGVRVHYVATAADVDHAPFEPRVLYVCAFAGELLQAVFERFAGVDWVHSSFAGVDHLLFPALSRSSVPLTNAKGVFSRSLAEFALGAMLFFAKDFRRMIREQAAHRWSPFLVEELHGANLCVVGYGDIGRAAATLARACGMRVTGVRRRAADGAEADVVGNDGLHDALRACDYALFALPLTRETRGCVGEPELECLHERAVVINVGRGPVIDERVLVRRLQDGSLKGAALDVFETEPLPSGHPLYTLENVLLSPHCADRTRTSRAESTAFFFTNLERFRRGEPLLNVVDKRSGY